MFEMSDDEFKNWRSQFVTSNFADKMGLRHKPFCFTEHGVLQSASVLKSNRAKQMSIRIIEVFIKMREMLLTHKDILLKMEALERQVENNSVDIQHIFHALKQLLGPPPSAPARKIGYK
jgi:hypothetical protein